MIKPSVVEKRDKGFSEISASILALTKSLEGRASNDLVRCLGVFVPIQSVSGDSDKRVFSWSL